MEQLENAHLAELMLAIRPREGCVFRYSPSASVHAALLRRLELMDPELSDALHNAHEGSRFSYHPWTVSQIKGLMRERDHLVAIPGEQYRVRITALAPRVIEGLAECFDAEKPLGAEPIYLENVPFDIVSEQTYWTNLTTYPSLLTRARPQSRIILTFESPTAFTGQKADQEPLAPTPRRCIEGYLGKWNAFSNIAISEDGLLEYVNESFSVVRTALRPANTRYRNNYVRGFIGSMEWQAQDRSGSNLRFVNALVNFSFYCGTGSNVSRGMGQTVRNRG